MANLSSYITSIEGAARGEQVRDSIIAALNAINEIGGNAQTLDGHQSSYYASAEDVHDVFFYGTYFDSIPTQGSMKAVTSDGLYTILGSISDALDIISGEAI